MEDKESITIRKAVINQAINYIFEHIDEDMTVEDVAKYCSYSKYHLTRMFKEDTDEALYQFIKRVRLERSAWRLKVEKERSITEIGETYGYSSSNFATAFKKHLDISPADYRRSSEQMVEDSSFSHGMTLDDLDDAGNKITVEYFAPFTVLYERKREIIIICQMNGVILSRNTSILQQKTHCILTVRLMIHPLQMRMVVCMNCVRPLYQTTRY